MIGIYEKAVYYYERAVNLNGEMAEAHYNLAVCMFMQENYYNALLCAEKAVKIAPKGDGYL
jgi:tetratricopeptide (TPR) repeat protein